jgi:uncharacterized protein YehS (DUF1456 family)
MINNDILRRVCTLLAFTDEKIRAVFELGQCRISVEQLVDFYKEKNDSDYKEIPDVELAGFLNGLIIEKRGASDAPQRENELELSNNQIFNKIKIALALKADDVIAIFELADVTLGKYELSAFFRNINHKHYNNCADDILSSFLKGLKIKFEK